MTKRTLRAAVSVAALIAVSAGGAEAAKGIFTDPLVNAVSAGGIGVHLQAFQDIANANGGTREASTTGYDASVAYIRAQLEASGYVVTEQPFDYNYFAELSIPVLEQVSPVASAYDWAIDFYTMEYSGSGSVTAPTQAVDVTVPPGAAQGSSGCEASDFAGFVPGNIAVIQRGTCTFAIKAENAEAAGAAGVIIFNDGLPGREDLLIGTLGTATFGIPIVGTTYAAGLDLAGLDASGATVAAPVVTLGVDATSEVRQSVNVIAETAGGRADRVVVVGAHLDSVGEGPGINDNGSGSGMILEIARQMAALDYAPRNKVRFAWWGAEESGLVGSTYYVSQLAARDIKNIAVNLNFDMVASPNFARQVYDGDGSATGTAGPNGSAIVEKVFNDWFAGKDLAVEATAFDGRSDYGPFIAVGIPAGGLFTGAEEIKTAEQAALFGGTAGVALDPCYHQACDTITNINPLALEQMSDAASHAVLTFAMTTSAINGTDKANPAANKALEEALLFSGNHLKR